MSAIRPLGRVRGLRKAGVAVAGGRRRRSADVSREAGKLRTVIVTVIAALLSGVVGSVLTMVTTERTTAAVFQQQERLFRADSEREDREKRRSAYFGYMKASDEYFRAVFATYGCVDRAVADAFAADPPEVLGSCRTPPAAGAFSAAYEKYRESREEFRVYGSEAARAHLDDIDAALPEVDPRDIGGQTLAREADYQRFPALATELRRISRCDLVAVSSPQDRCRG